MLRRLLRVLFTLGCALSLLGCVGACRLWRLSGRGYRHVAEAACGGVYVLAYEGRRGFNVVLVRGWPGPPLLRAHATRGYPPSRPWPAAAVAE